MRDLEVGQPQDLDYNWTRQLVTEVEMDRMST